jgi:HAD superfamily hydrolase (TIGR01509 family)
VRNRGQGRNISLVIFDCDGVLIDSEPIANRVFRDLLESAGLKMTLQDVMRTFVGSTKAGCIERAGQMLGRPLPDSLGDEWDRELFAALRAEVKPVEGIPELLASMKVPYCVASNGNLDRITLSLEAAGLMPWTKGKIFTAEEVAHPKPAPDLFLHAAKCMGFAAADCAVIEDTPTGVRAAVAAGIAVFGYAGAPHADADALRAAGATTFTAMRDLPALLEAA